MAAAYLKEYLQGARIESAGIDAVVGSGAHEFAKSVMSEMDIDIDDHRARQFESWMCKRYELILVMDTSQRKYIEQVCPFSRGKIFLFDKNGREIEDPFHGRIDKFKRVYAEIERNGTYWIDRLAQLRTTSVHA